MARIVESIPALNVQNTYANLVVKVCALMKFRIAYD